eukprot:TRINITY_DN123507_c0_g1_i1.p1 TRINITY_DN123507_c0_g1~~TRINITY_DN123507_c0_g1_i1.p1  ORF type:complete len:388 (+),score=114.02 TRINITY_DN123507_c0_g1_i1:170-1333(+)
MWGPLAPTPVPLPTTTPKPPPRPPGYFFGAPVGYGAAPPAPPMPALAGPPNRSRGMPMQSFGPAASTPMDFDRPNPYDFDHSRPNPYDFDHVPPSAGLGTMPKVAGAPPMGGFNGWQSQADAEADAAALAALNASGGLGSSTADLMTGVVKTWRDDRGFGFITPDGGADDVFVHRSVLSDGASLIKGSNVMFDVTYDVDRKGFKATKVVGAVEALPPEAQAEEDKEKDEFDFLKFTRPKEKGDKKGKGKGKDKGKDGKGKEKGKKKKKDLGGGDPLCPNAFFEDPWLELYSEKSEHLKQYLDGDKKLGDKKAVAAATNKPQARPRPGSEASTTTPVKKTAEQKAPAAAPEAAKAASGEAKGSAPEERKEESGGTTIYDFFNDEDVMM